MITLTIDGEPVGQMRAQRSASGRMFHDRTSKSHAYREAIRTAWRQSNQRAIEDNQLPLTAAIWCVFGRPKSHHVANNPERPLKSNAPIFHTCTPDADNIAKAVLDALNGWALPDDKQVVTLTVRKRYTVDADEQPHTEVNISPTYTGNQ